MPKDRRSHLLWLDKVGGWMLRIMVIGLVALTTVQLLMTSEPFRLYMSFAERLERRMVEAENSAPELAPVTTTPINGTEQTGEGEKGYEIYDEQNLNKADLTISLAKFTSLKKALVKVNGKPAGDLGNKEVTVTVSGGGHH